MATSQLLLTVWGLGERPWGQQALGAAGSLFPGDEEAVLWNLLSTGAAVQEGQEALGRVVRIYRRPQCPPALRHGPLRSEASSVQGPPASCRFSQPSRREAAGAVVTGSTPGALPASSASFHGDATHVLVSAKPLTSRDTHASQTVGITLKGQADGGPEEGGSGRPWGERGAGRVPLPRPVVLPSGD